MGDAPTPVGPNDWVAERFAEIDQIADASKQVEALLELEAELLPSPSDVLQRALAAADNIQYDEYKARALSAIAPHLPASDQRAVLERALTAADNLQYDNSKARALSAIAPHLPASEPALLERALTAADNIQDDEQKAKALIAIAPHLPASEPALLEHALTAADNIQNDYLKAEALSAIAPHLPTSEPALLEHALTAANTLQNDEYKAKALSSIASYLPASDQRAVLERALTAADNIQNDYLKAEALSAIAPHLPASEPALLERALTAADNIQDDNSKAKALIAIAPRLSASDQRAVLERALTVAEYIKNNEYKAEVLSAIAPHLPASEPALLKRAITAADNIQDDEQKSKALIAIAPHLFASKPALLERAITTADNITDGYFKAEALIAIAPHLPASEAALLKRAITAADNLQDDKHKARALSAIAPRLPASDQRAVLERALTAAEYITDGYFKAEALSAIAPHLPTSEPALLERALTVAEYITDYRYDKRYKIEALSAIAPHLPASDQRAVLERALTAVDNSQDDFFKAEALRAIAPHLSTSESALLERALTVAEYIKNDKYKARALIAIAPRLPASDQRAVLERALTAADNIKNNIYKARALSGIAPRLPASDQRAVLERVLTAADNIQNDYFKAEALRAIAPHLPTSEPALLERALTVAEYIKNDEYKAEVLSAIAPHLPASDPALLERALTAADNIQDDEQKAKALIAIAPHLPASEPALLKRALTAVKYHIYDYYKECKVAALRVEALIAIAPRLSASDQRAVLEYALTAADNIPDDHYKAEALIAIAPRLSASDQRAVLERALTAADNIQNDYVKAEALSAIAPHLPASEPALLERALTAAGNLPNDYSKAKALGAIAPHLPASDQRAVLERALTAADNSEDNSSKAKTLSAIAPQISQSNLKRFLEASSNLPDAAETLASPAIRLTKDFLQLYPSNKHSTALNIVKHIPDDADKTKFLSALIPHLTVGLLPNALRLIQTTLKADCYRTETLNNLVAYLPTDQTPEALDLITQFIKNPYYQTAALVELIPLLPIEHCDKVLNLLKAKIALPQYRASVLQALTKVLTTSEQTTQLTSVTSKVYSEVAPTDEDFLSAYQHLVGHVLTLTYQLKEPTRDDFSYERAASSIFSQLAPVLQHLAEPEQTAVFEAVTALADPGYQAAVLIALAPHFKYFAQTSLTTYTGDDYRNLLRIKIQLAFTDSLNPQDLHPIIDQFNDDQTVDIKSPYRNAEAWVELASHPAGKSHQTKALRAIQELQNNAYLQTQYLQRLIPHLAYQQRLEAANIINDIGDPYHQVSARVALARKFPESEFFEPARDGALALTPKDKDKTQDLALVRKGQVQTIQQLSTLAIDMPELLPRIIKLAEIAETAATPDTAEEEKDSQENNQQGNTFQKNIYRYGILDAISPHLPMRINREVKRTWCLSNTITDDLWDRALYLLARSYRDALTGGSLRNESAQDKDYLNLKDEIKSLSGLLLMRDLEPPMTVGILGGWGGGKSYIMHLMQQRMTDVRSRKVDPAIEAWNSDPNHEKLSPYVGHIYQIKFDAWTFAKSDLWASLMQTIFFELNRQISLEQQLAQVLAGEFDNEDEAEAAKAKVLCDSGPYWSALYKSSEEDKQYYLEKVLDPKHFEALQKSGQGEDNILWDEFLKQQYGKVKAASKKQLAEQEELRSQKAAQEEALKEKISAIEVEISKNEADQQAREQELRNAASHEITQAIDSALRISKIILIQRLGEPVFEAIEAQVYAALKNQNVDAENLQAVGSSARAAVTSILEKGEVKVSGETVYLARRALWQWLLKNVWVVVGCGILGLLSFTLPIVFGLPQFNNIGAQIAGLIVPLVPAIGLGQKLLNSSQKWYGQVVAVLSEYGEQEEDFNKNRQLEAEKVLEKRLVQDKQLKEWSNQAGELETQKSILVESLAAVETERAALDQAIQETGESLPEDVYGSLSNFVKLRTQDNSYDKQLGLMHQVKEDLWKLSNSLLPPANATDLENKIDNLKKVFPRGPARVVVYIDDLDRCPPRRVVQVLEAVQLLVKTPLFIAVLAIDERYITRALEQFYKGVLLRHGSPSGTDYLEKIIQLPYRVRPIMADNLETYLRSQVVIQDNATGGTKFSEFSRQEFNMLLACCKQVELTPRTLKRLTNVYKLFKIVCRTRGNKPNVQVQQAILALLALSGRYPNLMRGVFEAIETCFEEQRDEAAAKAIDARATANPQRPTLHLQSPLRAFFENYQLPSHDRYLQLEFDKLHHDALHPDILPPALTLEAMTHEIFNLIRSFSFVGEIGEDPDDYRRSGIVEQG